MEIKIDFDYASKCWRQNKKYVGNGYFVYTCNYIRSNGIRCRKTIYSQLNKNKYKYMHDNFEIYDRLNKHKNRHIYCKRLWKKYVRIEFGYS